MNFFLSLITDSFATGLAGLLGTSPGTAYIESATGIEEGGRTGITAVIAGLLFLPFMFFSPLLSVIPAIATAPALILVEVFMINPISKINWKNLEDGIPAFFAMILIPFSNSIAQGIIWGLLSWTFIKIILGKKEEISITLIIIDIFAIIALLIKWKGYNYSNPSSYFLTVITHNRECLFGKIIDIIWKDLSN